MRIERVGARHRRGAVGQLIPEALAVKVMNDDGTSMKDESVAFETSPEGCAEFDPGGNSWGQAKTDADGIARINIRPTRLGTFTASARVRRSSEGLFTITSTEQDGVIATPGGPIIVRRRPQETRAGFGWPAAIALATAVVALAVVLSLLGLKALSGKGGTGSTPGPGPTPIASGVDSTARAGVSRVQRDLRRVEGETKRELEFRPAHHEVEGYVEGRVENAERWSFGAANTVVGHVRDPDAHDGGCTSPSCITACRISPDLPACRRR